MRFFFFFLKREAAGTISPLAFSSRGELEDPLADVRQRDHGDGVVVVVNQIGLVNVLSRQAFDDVLERRFPLGACDVIRLMAVSGADARDELINGQQQILELDIIQRQRFNVAHGDVRDEFSGFVDDRGGVDAFVVEQLDGVDGIHVFGDLDEFRPRYAQCLRCFVLQVPQSARILCQPLQNQRLRYDADNFFVLLDADTLDTVRKDSEHLSKWFPDVNGEIILLASVP